MVSSSRWTHRTKCGTASSTAALPTTLLEKNEWLSHRSEIKQKSRLPGKSGGKRKTQETLKACNRRLEVRLWIADGSCLGSNAAGSLQHHFCANCRNSDNSCCDNYCSHAWYRTTGTRFNFKRTVRSSNGRKGLRGGTK